MNVIDSVEKLRTAADGLGIGRVFAQVPQYEFAIPELSASGNREATERLTNYRNACGCFAGGLFMSMTVIAFVLVYATSGRGISDFGVMDFLAFLALFTISTLVGKAVGVSWARLQAVRLVKRTVQLAMMQRA